MHSYVAKRKVSGQKSRRTKPQDSTPFRVDNTEEGRPSSGTTQSRREADLVRRTVDPLPPVGRPVAPLCPLETGECPQTVTRSASRYLFLRLRVPV